MNKRQKEVIEHQLTMEKAVLDALEKEYEEALKDINLKIQMYQAMPETQSKIYHRQYQETLKKQVEAALEKLHSDEYTTINQYLHDSYTTAFVGTMYDLHGQSVPVIVPIDQRAAIKAVVTDSKLSKPLYKKLGVDINKLKKTVSSEISRGIASGLLYDDIARNIQFRTKAPSSRAKAIARTDGHRIQQESAEDARQAAKAKGADVVKEWDATLDGVTRPTHRELDGQIRETDEPFEANGKKAMYPGDFGDPAEDCECRCVALTRSRSALDEDELKTLQERAKFFGLDKTKDFDDFKKKYLKAAEQIDRAEKADHPVTNKNGDVIIFDERFNTEKREQQIAILKELSDEYNTKLTIVRPYEKGENEKWVAGQVSPWGEMRLSSVKPDVAVHEFAHSLALSIDKKMGLDGNEAFWKDIRKIRKEYQNARRFNSSLTISAYAEDNIDEFFAEAFALAKGKQMGIQMPDTYGSDLTYANKVLDAVNKHFGKQSSTAKTAQTLENTGKSGIIEVTKTISGHKGTPRDAEPNAVIDHVNDDGRVDGRGFYDANGKKAKDIHTTDHGNPKRHQYGEHGEHGHDYQWNDDGSLKRKTTRELTDTERKENGNIL